MITAGSRVFLTSRGVDATVIVWNNWRGNVELLLDTPPAPSRWKTYTTPLYPDNEHIETKRTNVLAVEDGMLF
ncbi:MAG: hypothetical protein ABWY36_06275 [Leifsonia sp.]